MPGSKDSRPAEATSPLAEVDVACPACEASGVEALMGEENVPHFGRVLRMLTRCDSCGFRQVRLHFLEEFPPARAILTVEPGDDLSAKVIRSNTGALRIPELGFRMEPRELSDGFITNLEGVLERVGDAIGMVSRLVGTSDAIENGHALIEVAEAMRRGERGFTLIIEDPHGRSGILHPSATRELLTDAETAGLLGHFDSQP